MAYNYDEFNGQSLVFKYNVDNNGNPITVKIENENKQVSTHGTIQLEHVPDEFNRVLMLDDKNKEMVEVFNKDEITPTTYYIDYNNGVAYLDKTQFGKTKIYNYYSRGLQLIGCSRIFDEHDVRGQNVLLTLQEIIDAGKECIRILLNIGDAWQIIQRLESDIAEGRQLILDIEGKIIEARADVDGMLVELEDKKADCIRQIDEAVQNGMDNIVNVAGNIEIQVPSSAWVLNNGSYEKQITHNLNSEKLHISAINSDTKEAITIGYKVVDKSNVILKSDENINANIILSASYYNPYLYGNGDIAEEVVAARGDKANLKERLDLVDSSLETIETKKSDITYVDNKVAKISSGTPLFASSVAGMTDTTKNYVNTTDGYLYTYNGTGFVNSSVKYQELGISNGKVTNVKTNFIESGKNMINKLMCEDGFVYYDGTKRVNNSYTITEKIKVMPNTNYTVRGKAASTAYGDFITYWSDDNYIGVGYTNFIVSGTTYGNTFTTPSNCNCIIVSFLKTEKNSMQLEIGSTQTSYEEYLCYVNKYPINIVNYPVEVRDKTFKTIQEAVNYAVNGDTIYIKSGTYKENVDCKSKYLNFIGEGATSTILYSISNNYYIAPLHIAKGYVKGIQILAQKPTDWTLPGGDNKTPYAVHIDWNESSNSSLTFEDCIIKSEWNASAGIGLRKGFTLTFKNCELISTGGVDTGSVGGLFFHDNYIDGYDGLQAIIFDNCNIKSVNTEKWLRVDSSGRIANDVKVTFRRCIAYSPVQTGSGINNVITVNGNGWLYSNNMTLTQDSFGNNNEKLNHI